MIRPWWWRSFRRVLAALWQAHRRLLGSRPVYAALVTVLAATVTGHLTPAELRRYLMALVSTGQITGGPGADD